MKKEYKFRYVKTENVQKVIDQTLPDGWDIVTLNSVATANDIRVHILFVRQVPGGQDVI